MHKLKMNLHVMEGEIKEMESVGKSYTASMVGAGEQLACSHGGDVIESGGLLAAAARRPLQHVHEVGDEEVVLQCRHTLLRQD